MPIRGFGDVTTNDRSDRVRLEDLVDLLKFPPKEWELIRLIGPIYSYYEFWIKIKTKSGKIVSIRKLCLDWDNAADNFTQEICPYRKGGLRGRKVFLVNAIVRRFQEEKPEKRPQHTKKELKKRMVVDTEDYKAHLKEKGSKSWTPVRVVRVVSTLATQFQNLAAANTYTNKETGEKRKAELMNPRYGRDVNILVDPDATGSGMYNAQKEDRTKLSEEELEYLLYKLDVEKPETLEVAKKEWANLKPKMVEEEEEEDEKSKGKSRSKKSSYYEGDEDEDEDDHHKKKNKKKKSSRDLEDEDDDDNDSFDSDDLEDEDDPPKKKKKNKKKHRDEVEDDDDE